MHKQDWGGGGGNDWDRGKEQTWVKKGKVMYASYANVLQFCANCKMKHSITYPCHRNNCK